MKHTLRLIFVFFFILSFGWKMAFAQRAKHPRVVDLEKHLTKEALDILKSRFPDQPFLASVSIDPLHREKAAKGQGENLPYYMLDEEEIVDEWDDVQVPQVVLMNRIKRINVILSLPATLNDDEVAEIKSSITDNLGLMPARDNIEVRKRSFGKSAVNPDAEKEKKKEDFLSFAAYSGLAWSLLMVGLFIIAWYVTSRLSKAAKEIKIAGGTVNGEASGSSNGGSGGINSAAGGMGAGMPGAASAGFLSGKQSISGDFKFNDPLKTREVILNSLKRLEDKEIFPSFEDMILIDDFCRENAETCGALMAEFPTDLKNHIFSLSKGKYWLDALCFPGEINSKAIEFLNTLIRQPRTHLTKSYEELLISVWRLDKKMSDFFKGENQDLVFTLLSKLPSSISIPVAREIFPGAWASLINKSFKPVEVDSNKMKDLIAKAQKLMPLRLAKEVIEYQESKEMLKFLKTVDPVTEKEIYLAANNKSLEDLRPPFYPIFEVDAAIIKKIYPIISIEEWALCFLNVSRPERKNVEILFSDKQKFKYFHLLKQYDQSNPPKEVIGLAREKVGKILFELVKNQIASEVDGVQNETQSKVA